MISLLCRNFSEALKIKQTIEKCSPQLHNSYNKYINQRHCRKEFQVGWFCFLLGEIIEQHPSYPRVFYVLVHFFHRITCSFPNNPITLPSPSRQKSQPKPSSCFSSSSSCFSKTFIRRSKYTHYPHCIILCQPVCQVNFWIFLAQWYTSYSVNPSETASSLAVS